MKQAQGRLELYTRRIVTKLTYTADLVFLYEKKLGIQERWGPEHEEWQETMKYLHERKYRIALSKLEGLVVQRIFELEKANCVGTGM